VCPAGFEPTTADKGRSIAATMGLPDPMGAGREAEAPSVLSPGAGLVEIAVELVGAYSPRDVRLWRLAPRFADAEHWE
jgi:hypothetical protein